MEVVIIIFVVGVMISGILPLFLSVIAANRSAAYYSLAYKLADSKIEEMRSISFSEIDEEDGTYEISGLPDGQMIVTISDEIDGEPQEGIRQVVVDLSWNYKSEKSHTISTLITEEGIGK